MAQQDLYSNIKTKVAIKPQALSGSNDITGETIDTDGFESVVFVLATDAIAATLLDAQLLIQEGDESDLSDASAVADANLLGTEAATAITSATATDTNRIGYSGTKRYVRSNLTVTTNDGTDVIGAIAILGHPEVAPTSAD